MYKQRRRHTFFDSNKQEEKKVECNEEESVWEGGSDGPLPGDWQQSADQPVRPALLQENIHFFSFFWRRQSSLEIL